MSKKNSLKNIYDVMNEKVEKLRNKKGLFDPKEEDLEFSSEEKDLISKKVEELVRTDVENQKRIRRGMANALSSEILGVPGKKEISKYIDGLKELGEEDKALIKQFTNEDYVNIELIKGKALNGEFVYHSRLTNIRNHFDSLVRERYSKIKEIMESDVWKFCNGRTMSSFFSCCQFRIL